MLEEFGIHTLSEGSSAESGGFPFILPLPDGQNICLDLPQPAMLATLDPGAVGVAMLDHLGFATRRWGLAEQIGYFDGKQSCFDAEIEALISGAFRGTPGALYLDGYRYYASGLHFAHNYEVFVLVTNAEDEKSAKGRARKSARSADALKRVGKALTMHQTLQPMCLAAVHEIASTLELAAVLLWTSNLEDETLELRASVGANRQGTSVLNQLNAASGQSCVAELVASSRHPFKARSVSDNVLTASLEAKFCYLKPGGIWVLPLTMGNRLVGVLELIGRESDANYADNQELIETIAEHLALALNSALMFENVERLASIDALTGIANHRSMQEFLLRRVAESERYSQEMGVIMLDVDHFRSFNEEEGHDAGDVVLQRVVDVLNGAVRNYDLAARYGGEEFTVIMPSSSAEDVLQVAERIRERIADIEYVTKSGRIRKITASLGCSLFPANSTDPPGLLKAADSALFQAKKGGRNRTIFYEGPLREDKNALDINLEEVRRWIRPELVSASAELLQRLDHFVHALTRQLGLSRVQEQILRASILISPSFLEASKPGNETQLSSYANAPELRPLVPSLEALEERFDGQGKSGREGTLIPLLGRILKVLLALDDKDSRSLREDLGRFDPEIVAVVAEFDEAA